MMFLILWEMTKTVSIFPHRMLIPQVLSQVIKTEEQVFVWQVQEQPEYSMLIIHLVSHRQIQILQVTNYFQGRPVYWNVLNTPAEVDLTAL